MATLILPVLVLAVPILDTTLVTVVRLLDGRPISQGGRDHSSHRLVRFGLSEQQRGAAARADLARHRRLEPRLQRARQLGYTIIGVVVTFALLVQFASFLADVDRRPLPSSAPGFAQVFAVHWRRLVEVLVDFVRDHRSFFAAYAIRFGWPGTDNQRSCAT